jgi:hypothetical protein
MFWGESEFLMRIRHLFISPGHNFFGHHGREPDAHPVIGPVTGWIAPSRPARKNFSNAVEACARAS